MTVSTYVRSMSADMMRIEARGGEEDPNPWGGECDADDGLVRERRS